MMSHLQITTLQLQLLFVEVNWLDHSTILLKLVDAQEIFATRYWSLFLFGILNNFGTVLPRALDVLLVNKCLYVVAAEDCALGALPVMIPIRTVKVHGYCFAEDATCLRIKFGLIFVGFCCETWLLVAGFGTS